MPGRQQPFVWARLAVLAALVLGTFGLGINDEQDQASAFHNLANGSLQVVEHPEQYYRARDGMHKAVRFPGEQPVGSTLLNYLAIPVLLAVRAADEIAPFGLWTSAAAIALAWSLVPPERRRPLGAWGAAGAMLLLASGFRFAEIDIDLVGPAVALQMTNVLLLGATAAFLAGAIGRHVEGPARSVALAAVLAGPLIFWGARLKYSMLAATLVAAALWLVGEPPSSRRNLAIGIVAALAVWNIIAEGAVLVGAAVLWFGIETIREKSWSLPRLAIPLTGLALGLVPWALENQVLRGHPLLASYLVAPVDGAPSQGSGALHYLSVAFAGEIWNGPADFLANLVGQWTTGWRLEEHAIGVFAISPLLALGTWTVVRTRWWRRSDQLLAVALLALHVAMLTNRVVRHGWGLDARLLLPMLPAVGLLAAPAIARLLHQGGPRAASTAVKVALAWSALGLLLFGLAGVTFSQGLRNVRVDRTLFWAWEMLSLSIVLCAGILQWSRIASWGRPVTPVAVGVMLSMPLLWSPFAALLGSTVAPAAEEGENVSAFIPLVEDVREWIIPSLFPFGPLPIVTDENGRVVFHPDYGYCAVDPSPCPWWNNQTVGSVAVASS